MQERSMESSRRLRYALPGALVLVMALGGVFLLRPARAAQEQRGARRGDAIDVVVRRVRQVARGSAIAASGDIDGRSTVNVGFKVAGAVARVVPEEGDAVRAGEVIAELESDGYALGLQIASAGADRARDTYTRAKRMADSSSLPPADFVAAQAGLRAAEAQEALARKQVTDTKLIAPISGLVARRGVQPGEQVGAGMPVFTIIGVDPVEARVGIPEAEIGRVRVGQAAEVRVPSLNGSRYTGRVRVVGVAADPVSRTYTVRISIPNPNRILKPGMIVEASIDDGRATRTMTLPGEAILQDTDGAALVYVVDPADQRAQRRRVQVGSVVGREVEITSGLSGNEMVVVGGQHRLRAGALVKARVDSIPSVPRAGI